MWGEFMGLGPVFAYEWLVSSRRWQGYAVRSLFLLVLLVALIFVENRRAGRTLGPTLGSQAELAETIYLTIAGTQLALLLLVAPAATAGALCVDRARGTLTYLLMTDLRDSEIVLGKLAARLLPVLGLVCCTLPLTSLLSLMGGVDPDALIGAFLVALGVSVLGCGMALAFSLRVTKTHEALLGTYAVWCLWLLSEPILRYISIATGISMVAPARTIDPLFLIFAPYWYPGMVQLSDYLWFLAGASGVALVLVAAAVLSVRRVCTRDNGKKRTRWGRFPAPVLLANLVRRLPGPSLDGNPVLWREWHRNRPSRWSVAILGLYLSLATFFTIFGIVTKSPILCFIVNGFQVSIGLLIPCIVSATSLAEERSRGSLDVLMATTLSTREIVIGKWLGSFRIVPLLAILPSVLIVGAASNPTNSVVGGLVMCTYVSAIGAALASLGLALATWCSRLGRALGLSITAYVLVTVGWMFAVMATMSPEPIGLGVISGSPFYGPIVISREFCDPRGLRGHSYAGWLAFWIFSYSAAASALLVATLLSFNRCLGRVETGPDWYPRNRKSARDVAAAEAPARSPDANPDTAAPIREPSPAKP
jgi:ABC-type transport system involved in multi-copper enzyme maturation permease subunit